MGGTIGGLPGLLLGGLPQTQSALSYPRRGDIRLQPSAFSVDPRSLVRPEETRPHNIEHYLNTGRSQRAEHIGMCSGGGPGALKQPVPVPEDH